MAGETLHYAADEAPLDHLTKAARAHALRTSPKDAQTHLALGKIQEEFFYAEDLFGLKQESLGLEEGEGEAETSSKEEEFLAICKLHGVAPSAPAAVQLKAVEAEYQSLKEAGQTHKADHVQGLYAWKSKKLFQVVEKIQNLTKKWDFKVLFLRRLVKVLMLWIRRVHYTEPSSSMRMQWVSIPLTLWRATTLGASASSWERRTRPKNT